MRRTRTIYLYLAFSCIAAVLIFILTGMTPSHPTSPSFYEKIGIISIFILCCFLGISFTIKPNWIQHCITKGKNVEKIARHNGERLFLGHHPDCPIFQNHIISFNKKTWCAGCFGLLIGLIVSISLMILYGATNTPLAWLTPRLLLILGFLMISLVYIETFSQKRKPIVHVVVSSVFPVGFCFIEIAIISITRNFIYSLFAILFCVLLLDTRIQLSKLRHSLLCTQCPESCKSFPLVP